MDSGNVWPQKPGGASSTPAGPKAGRSSLCNAQNRPLAPLSGRDRIGNILKNGKRIHGRRMNLLYMGRDGGGGPRLAVIVPRRCGNAVKRNRIRRILREEARLCGSIRDCSCDVVLFWKEAIKPNSGRDAHIEARTLLRRLTG
jgi:ribonuclease P protein component